MHPRANARDAMGESRSRKTYCILPNGFYPSISPNACMHSPRFGGNICCESDWVCSVAHGGVDYDRIASRVARARSFSSVIAFISRTEVFMAASEDFE